MLSNSVGHFLGVNPESALTWEKSEQLLPAQSNLPVQSEGHFMVDASTTCNLIPCVAFPGTSDVYKVLPAAPQALAEDVHLALACEPRGAEGLGDEGQGSDLAYHRGSPV
jgi:hypothetical protein